MKINWSIKLGIGLFIGMVFGWIIFPSHALTEWKQFFMDLSVWLAIITLMWFAAWRVNCIVKYTEELEHKNNVADKIEKRKAEITMPEMRENAESFLTQDQKVQLETNRRYDDAAKKYVTNANVARGEKARISVVESARCNHAGNNSFYVGTWAPQMVGSIHNHFFVGRETFEENAQKRKEAYEAEEDRKALDRVLSKHPHFKSESIFMDKEQFELEYLKPGNSIYTYQDGHLTIYDKSGALIGHYYDTDNWDLHIINNDDGTRTGAYKNGQVGMLAGFSSPNKIDTKV